jgi:hypothetical protein
VGHACELGAARVDIPGLRAASNQYAPALQQASQRFWHRWLDDAL